MAKKKKKQTKLVLLNSLELMTYKDRQELIKELTEKMKDIFREHIGEENHISSYELFFEMLGVDPNELDSYLVFYWLSVLNVIVRKLRKGDVFIIKKYKNFFVLKTEKEARYYKGVIDRDIKNLGNAKVRADDWVRNEKWKELEE